MFLNPRSVGIYVNRCVLEVLVEGNKRLSLYYAMNKEEITPLFRFIFCAQIKCLQYQYQRKDNSILM